MLKVGLTGGIGSGKSTVSKILLEEGIPVIDADVISREVISIYPEILILIKKEFGEAVVDETGALQRRELGNIVFAHEEKRIKLESIIIPFIMKEIFKQLEKYKSSGAKLCIVDAPTLIEHGLHKEMDKNILVWVDRQTQIIRVTKRDIMKEKEVINRINSQYSLDSKREKVDYVIDNTGTFEETKVQVISVVKQLIKAEVKV